MRNDIIQQFVTLQRQLTTEKKEIEARLRQINEALGEITAMATTSATATPASAAPVVLGGGRPGGASLRTLVLETLSEGPKTKEEVLARVQKRGFKFTSKDPLNSLGVILYGKNPRFSRVDGRFSLPAGAGAGSASRSQNGAAGRRQMSAAARARIAEAARRRWAQARVKQGKAARPARPAAASSGKRTMGPAARARIAEAARRRWAAAKAAGRNNL